MKYFEKGIRMNTNDEITNGGNLFENLNFLNSKEFLEVSEQLSDIQFDKTAAVTTLMRTNSPKGVKFKLPLTQRKILKNIFPYFRRYLHFCCLYSFFYSWEL